MFFDAPVNQFAMPKSCSCSFVYSLVSSDCKDANIKSLSNEADPHLFK